MCYLYPVDIIVRHAGQVIDDQPDAGHGKLTEDQTQEKGPRPLEERGTTVFENNAFD